MKIKLRKSDLLSAVNIAGRAIPAKTTMPILTCFLVEAYAEGIYFSANDTELAVRTMINPEKCEIFEPGSIAIDARLLSEIVRKISLEESAEVMITSDGTLVEITSGNSLFRIQEKDPEQFPGLPEVSESRSISLSQFTLKEIIRDTIFSIAQNDSNKMMTGELFEVKGDNLRVISLDGHRISIRNTGLKKDYGELKAIIPGKTLNEISKVIADDNEKEIILYFDPSFVSFQFEGTVMVSRLIDGEFFRIDSMLSSDYETKLTVNKREFLSSVERASILISESDKKPLILKIEEETLNLRVNSQTGFLDDVLYTEKAGKNLMIAFNPKFLLDSLRAIDKETVTLYMTTPKAPCFIRDEENTYIYLILPVNFNPSAY